MWPLYQGIKIQKFYSGFGTCQLGLALESGPKLRNGYATTQLAINYG